MKSSDDIIKRYYALIKETGELKNKLNKAEKYIKELEGEISKIKDEEVTRELMNFVNKKEKEYQVRSDNEVISIVNKHHR